MSPATDAVPTVHYEVEDGVARITLDDAATRNALGGALRAGVTESVRRFADDDSAAVAVLSGAGAGFCSGAAYSPDVPQLEHVQPPIWAVRNRIRGLAEILVDVWRCPKPIVAKLHGFCFAAGVQLAAACDLVVITEECRLGWPKLPLGGGFISPMLAWSIGPKRAKEMSFVVGSEFSGRDAAEWGLANVAVPEPELDATVDALVEAMTRRGAAALQRSKARVNGELERQGFIASVLAGGEWDAIAHEDPILDEAFESVRALGFKAAIQRYAGPARDEGGATTSP